MKILLIGSGGREHSLAWKLSQSPKVTKIISAPGNPGMKQYGACFDIQVDDLDGLLALALAQKVDLTVIGPELPLVKGIVDLFKANSLSIIGPSAFAAQLEGSKAFAKKMMTMFNVPTAPYQVFEDYNSAKKYLEKNPRPIVIKADGLAAGKGVYLCKSIDESLQAIAEIMLDKKFGTSGEKVVCEEMLAGEEVSFLVFTDGENIIPLPSSQDHKAAYDGDVGPNTGGMGAYSPAPVFTEELQALALKNVIEPILAGMKHKGHPYQGILYAGLMIGSDNSINVLEFNVRFGDPECQSLLLKMKSDLAEVFMGIANSSLSQVKVEWHKDPSVCVVLTAKGYPGSYNTGNKITGLDTVVSDKVVVFQASTKGAGGNIVTNGGRVLNICAINPDLKTALNIVYTQIDEIDFAGKTYRKDIAHKALIK